MTSQNEEAEELMRKIEKEEERLAYANLTDSATICGQNLVITRIVPKGILNWHLTHHQF